VSSSVVANQRLVSGEMAPSGHQIEAFDFLAVEAYSWSPNLETACEICLCQAEKGLRVGFAFLDILNLDEYHQWGTSAKTVAKILRQYRLLKVKLIAKILRSRGVHVFRLSDRDVSTLRLTCEQAHVKSVEDLRNLRLGEANIGLGVLSSLIFHCQSVNPDLTAYRELTDTLLTCALRAYRLTTDLIVKTRPQTILVFNGRFAAAKAIVEAARQQKVDVLYHEVGSTKERYYLSSKTCHSATNARLLLQEDWRNGGPDRESIAERFFAPSRQRLGLLEGRYDNGQKRNKVLPPTGRRRFVYYASSVDEFAAVEDGYDTFLFATQREAVQWLVDWVRAHPDTELVIRLHPRMRNLSAQEREWWLSFSGGNILTIPGEHPCDSYALAESADRVVTFHSSLGPEATYLGRVSILVGDAKYRGLDCVYEPLTVEELDSILSDPSLPPKPRQNCLPFGYGRIMGGTPYRFYKARTFSDGSFFGKAYPPLPSRLEIRARKMIGFAKGFIDRVRTKRAVVYWS